ncbi:MAG: TlpA family protein disulfide reductase [Proteobacteria bacterium]|nr:TlpA family protein disulfide reductase [Pseudomonadota bacterium]
MIAEGPSANLPPHIALEFAVAFSPPSKPLILALLVLAAGCDRQSAPAPQPSASSAAAEALTGQIDRSHHGARMPDLTFKDAKGQELRLTSLVGRPVLVNVWATWCGPCVAELPTLAKLATSPGAPRVVTVSEDMGEPGKVGAFLAQRGLTALPGWLDPENSASSQYNLETLPTTIYYDKAGREVWRYVGGHDWSGAEARTMLAEAH